MRFSKFVPQFRLTITILFIIFKWKIRLFLFLCSWKWIVWNELLLVEHAVVWKFHNKIKMESLLRCVSCAVWINEKLQINSRDTMLSSRSTHTFTYRFATIGRPNCGEVHSNGFRRRRWINKYRCVNVNVTLIPFELLRSAICLELHRPNLSSGCYWI